MIGMGTEHVFKIGQTLLEVQEILDIIQELMAVSDQLTNGLTR